MPTLVIPVENNEISLYAELALPSEDTESQSFHAIADTGAQITGITQRVVDQLQAEPFTTGTSIGIEGTPQIVPIYRLLVGVAITTPEFDAAGNLLSEHTYISGGHLDVMLLGNWSHEQADVLLGMDLLQRFHITMYAGSVILSN